MGARNLIQRGWRFGVRRCRHWGKFAWQSMFLKRRQTRPLFIMGAGRSGTSMLLGILDQSAEVLAYGENDSAAMQHYRLREVEYIQRLLRRSPARVTVFKPITQSQWTDRFLQTYDGARAIWIYRGYQDTANSAVRKWGDHQKDVVRRIAAEDWQAARWRGERLSDSSVALAKEVYHDNMLPEEGAAVWWYLRNAFFFELCLDQDERVLLVNYEDLVRRPDEVVSRICAFAGCRYNDRMIRSVHARSVARDAFPDISRRVAEACGELQARLDAAWQRHVAGPVPGA